MAQNRTAEQIAAGFLAIAVDNMAQAIKKISVQNGYEVSAYTLCCFRGAGGQYACAVADVWSILIHPYAGLLSAYGMGLAALRSLHEMNVEQVLNAETLAALDFVTLAQQGREVLLKQGVVEADIELKRQIHE